MARYQKTRRSDEEWFQLINECRRSGLSDSQWCKQHDIKSSTFFCAIKRLRQKAYVIPNHDDSMEVIQNALPKGSRMDKAITYIKNRRTDMMTYLEDGRCSFCNNLSEIEIKPVALGRKNYLFSDTVAGAESSAVIYSLVETAKANGLNMYHYLWYLLEKLPQTDLSEEAFTRYLPWNAEVKTDLEKWAKKLIED